MVRRWFRTWSCAGYAGSLAAEGHCSCQHNIWKTVCQTVLRRSGRSLCPEFGFSSTCILLNLNSVFHEFYLNSDFQVFYWNLVFQVFYQIQIWIFNNFIVEYMLFDQEQTCAEYWGLGQSARPHPQDDSDYSLKCFCFHRNEMNVELIGNLLKKLELLKQWPYGDLAQLGDQGITLSGGQRARIALARALYQVNGI